MKNDAALGLRVAEGALRQLQVQGFYSSIRIIIVIAIVVGEGCCNEEQKECYLEMIYHM
jgi:hypothetical protein